MNSMIPYRGWHPTLLRLRKSFETTQECLDAMDASERDARRKKGDLKEKDYLLLLESVEHDHEKRADLVVNQRRLRTTFDGALLALEINVARLREALGDLVAAVDAAIDDHSLKARLFDWRVGMNNVLAAFDFEEQVRSKIAGIEEWMRDEKEVPLGIYPHEDMLLHSYTEAVRRYRRVVFPGGKGPTQT